MNRALTISTILGATLLSACSSSSSTRDVSPSSMPVQRFVAEREPWSFEGDSGWTYYTPSATIRTTLRDRAMLIRLPGFVELAQVHARNALAVLPEPDRPVETYVLGTRRGWESLTRRILKDRASTYLAIERGGYSAGSTGVFYDIGPKDTFTIAAHEGWHQYAHSTLANPLPVWLDEGIACYVEGFRWNELDTDTPDFLPWANLERFDALRRASSAGTLMPLHTLVSTRPQDLMATDRGADRVLTYYAQLWALVHFFRESGYSTGLSRTLTLAHQGTLLDHMSDGDARQMRTRRTGPGVLDIIAPGVTLSELDDDYRAFINRIVSVGGRDRVLMGESPIR